MYVHLCECARAHDQVVDYNAQALTSLRAVVPGRLLVNDLWATMIAACGKLYTSCSLQLPKNVHLTPEGIAATAASAARDILAALAPA